MRGRRSRATLLGAWQRIYLAHDRLPCPSRTPCSAGQSCQTSPLDRTLDALDDVRRARRIDHEWVADLHGVRALWRARRSVLRECLRRPWLPPLEPAGRMARGRTELAFRAGVAARRGRRAVPLVSRLERRVAVAAVSAARYSRGDRDAEVLPPTPQGSSAAGKAQSAPEARLHLHYSAWRAVGPHGIRDLQADAILLAHRAVRRISGGAVLALLGRVDLHRVSRRARHSRVRRRPRVTARHDLRLVSRPVPQP